MFRTEVDVPPTGLALALQDKVITMGSCFAEVIGAKLEQHKVDVLVNPFGTIFNPVSVCRLLQAAAGTTYDFEPHLVQQHGIWYSYDVHSSLSSPDKKGLLAQLRERVHQTKTCLQEASLLVITLGTSVAYRLADTDNLVANCHKLPAKNFSKALLSQHEIMLAFHQLLTTLQEVNPRLTVLLTVSPVRHIKETLLLNSVSKSLLRVVCHHVEQSHPQVRYFPAFEIMQDDLRDYRFYKDDLLHPTSMAEDYIWQKFVHAYYNAQFQQFVPEWDKAKKALEHKAFHPESDAHQRFLLNTEALIKQIARKYNVDVTPELSLLQKQFRSGN